MLVTHRSGELLVLQWCWLMMVNDVKSHNNVAGPSLALAFQTCKNLASSNVSQEPLSRPWHELNLLHMAYLDNLDVLHTASHILPPCHVPVVILKGREALESNARDPPWRAKQSGHDIP